jgi:cell division protein FtsL
LKTNEAATLQGRIFESANQALGAGEFWRPGNLAQAVHRKDFKGTVWGVLALGLLLFFYVWQHMEVVKLGYEVQSLKMEKQKLTNQYYYLRYKLYDVESLPRVEKIARERLGMATPRSEQVVILPEGGWNSPSWLSYWTSMMKKTERR